MRASATLIAFAVAVSAQKAPKEYASPLNMTVDPGSVDEATKNGWCQAQYNTCYALCDDAASTNDCEQSDLSYECLCSENNSAPGLEYYGQTMPTFICEELYSQCNVANVGDARAQDECKTNIQDKCGSLKPPSRGSNDDDEDDDDDSDSTSTSASATSSPTETSSGDDAEETGDDDSLAAAGAAPRIAMAAGAGLLAYLI